MKVMLKIVIFVFLCGLGAIAHAADIEQQKVYGGGFTKADVFIIKDKTHGVMCWVFDGGGNITSHCLPASQVENFDKELK